MKIAYLFGSLNRGGTETLMLDVFKHCQKAEIDIIGVYRKDGALCNEFKDTGVPLFQLWPRFTLDFIYFLRLRKVLKKHRVNIVHAQQAIDALYARIACLGTGMKVVLTFHGYNYRYGLLRNMITRFIINKTDLNIYVSESQKKNYFENYKISQARKQHVVYNGISFEKFNNIEQKSLRREFKIRETSMLMGSVGSFVKVRDQMTICRFLNLLSKKEIDFAFIFAGARVEKEAELFDQCIKYCEEHNLSEKVFFPGSRNDIPNILSQLDAFVYSTSHDTFGIAVIEAMAMRIPVFVNGWEVMKEITDNGQHGIIYKTKSEKDLFDQFMLFIQNKKKFVRTAAEDGVWARKKYSISNHVDVLLKIYASL